MTRLPPWAPGQFGDFWSSLTPPELDFEVGGLLCLGQVPPVVHSPDPGKPGSLLESLSFQFYGPVSGQNLGFLACHLDRGIAEDSQVFPA